LSADRQRAAVQRRELAQSAAMDTRVALAVYFLIAAAAAFVTATRTLTLPILLLVLVALGVVAVLVRRQVIGPGVTARASARISVGFIAVYLVTFFVLAVLFRR
jgi:hypothetical protein